MEDLFIARVSARLHLPEVEIVRDHVLVDVTHTAKYDLHTGIQRVVRETTAWWLAKPNTTIVHWNSMDESLKLLDDTERQRFTDWAAHMPLPGTAISARSAQERSSATVVPWQCLLLVPELIESPARCEGYTTMARSGVLCGLSLIGYDLVPVTAAETVADGMTTAFCNYLSVVKHATRLSAISASAANEFRAFAMALAGQGLSGPTVTATHLPASAVDVGDKQIQDARRTFELGSLPLVLAVGSHEPRKNHLVLLEAAESLWRRGLFFELLLVGGSSWRSDEFDRYVEFLANAGFPVQIYRRVSEEALWSLYRIARFSVFTSLTEGYGLPVAESLCCGTPVITTNYGSMAEIAAGGGAIEVDPRNPADVASAMERLLTDDSLLDTLREVAHHARLVDLG